MKLLDLAPGVRNRIMKLLGLVRHNKIEWLNRNGKK